MARKIRSILLPGVLGLGGFLGLVATANADSISGPFTTSTPIPTTKTNWPAESLTFAQFNPALGTLESVELQFSAKMYTTLTVTNENGNTSSAGQAYTELEITVQDSGDHLADLASDELDIDSPKGNYSLAPNGSVTLPQVTKNASADDTYTLGAVLNEFTGAGTISLPASTYVEAWSSNTNGSTTASDITDASLTGTVTYDYTPPPEGGPVVPEPATMGAVLAAGAIGLGSLLRRRRTL